MSGYWISHTFVNSCFRIDRKIHGKWSVDLASFEIATLVHLGEIIGIDCWLHLWIHCLNCTQRSNLRAFDATCMCDFYCIVDDIDFICKGWICIESYVCEEQKTVNAFNLKYTYMRQHLSGTKSDFFIQYAL